MKKEEKIKILIEAFNGDVNNPEHIKRAEERMEKIEETTKRFIHLAEKGAKNAENVLEELEKRKIERYEAIKEGTKHIKDIIAKMIPKEELKDGVVYDVEPEYARGVANDKAKWDAKKGEFVYMRYKFGWREDYMDYFGDVAWTNIAGCAPMKIADEQVL